MTANDEQTSVPTTSSIRIEWIWQSNPDPSSKSQPDEWSYYSDVENLIIEEAFLAKQTHVMLDDCCIDFEHGVRISNYDANKQKPLKRVVCKREDKHLREEHFMPDPIAPKRPFGGEYGWVSPFILEVRKDLNLESTQRLPSRDETIIPMIVEKAALGIIEEGKKIGKLREGEKIAKILMEKKDKEIKEVWECCARLYTMDSFLYKKLNESMRLIGSDEHEKVWRSKIRTLGPFCLLLWDNPLNDKPSTEMILYRGANLTDEQIATYIDCSERPNEYRSFQAFTSCSRNREVAEMYSVNALFLMKVDFAFTVNLTLLSQYSDEEEELITPGVCFTVQSVEYDENTKKQLIFIQLRQRFSESDKRQLSYTKNSTTTNHISGYTLSTYDDVISNCRDHSGLRIDLHYDGLDGFDLLRRRLGDDSLSFLHNDLLGHLGLPDITGLDRAPDYNDALHYDRDGNYHP